VRPSKRRQSEAAKSHRYSIDAKHQFQAVIPLEKYIEEIFKTLWNAMREVLSVNLATRLPIIGTKQT